MLKRRSIAIDLLVMLVAMTEHHTDRLMSTVIGIDEKTFETNYCYHLYQIKCGPVEFGSNENNSIP